MKPVRSLPQVIEMLPQKTSANSPHHITEASPLEKLVERAKSVSSG